MAPLEIGEKLYRLFYPVNQQLKNVKKYPQKKNGK